MRRLDYELKIDELLEEACCDLHDEDFEKLLERVQDMINGYE